MKKTILIPLLFICFSKTSLFSQDMPHNTINSIEVLYKSLPPVLGDNSPGIKTRATAQIFLKSDSLISKIYFKILNTTNDVLVYQVEYNLVTSPITSIDGFNLFEKIGNEISITCPNAVILKPYIFQIETEDNLGVKSEIYSAIK